MTHEIFKAKDYKIILKSDPTSTRFLLVPNAASELSRLGTEHEMLPLTEFDFLNPKFPALFGLKWVDRTRYILYLNEDGFHFLDYVYYDTDRAGNAKAISIKIEDLVASWRFKVLPPGRFDIDTIEVKSEKARSWTRFKFLKILKSEELVDAFSDNSGVDAYVIPTRDVSLFSIWVSYIRFKDQFKQPIVVSCGVEADDQRFVAHGVVVFDEEKLGVIPHYAGYPKLLYRKLEKNLYALEDAEVKSETFEPAQFIKFEDRATFGYDPVVVFEYKKSGIIV